MLNHVSHFDIHADDLARARRFYERVFGWVFRASGPPDFSLIQISVDDIEATAVAVEANGGEVTQPRTVIATVGTLIQFHDTEGNVVCAMQYDPDAR